MFYFLFGSLPWSVAVQINRPSAKIQDAKSPSHPHTHTLLLQEVCPSDLHARSSTLLGSCLSAHSVMEFPRQFWLFNTRPRNKEEYDSRIMRQIYRTGGIRSMDAWTSFARFYFVQDFVIDYFQPKSETSSGSMMDGIVTCTNLCLLHQDDHFQFATRSLSCKRGMHAPRMDGQ